MLRIFRFRCFISLCAVLTTGLLVSGPSLAQQYLTPKPVSLQNEQGIKLKAFRFDPVVGSPPYKAVVMMHGCSGVYSNGVPNLQYDNLQTNFRGWGTTLAKMGIIAILVDSFMGRRDPITGAPVPQN